MKISIQKAGKAQDINIQGLTGKDIKDLLKKAAEIQKKDNPEDVAIEYVDMVDTIAAKISGMSVDELNSLDIEDKEKITAYIGQKVQTSIGFSMSSMK